MSSAWATLSDYYQPPTARDILALASMQDQAEDRKERRRLLAMQAESDRSYIESWNELDKKAHQVKQQTMQPPAQGQGNAFDTGTQPQVGPTAVASRTQAIGQRLKGLGMSDDQIAGSLGGLSTETAGFDPNAVNPKTGAFGIGQWLGDRLKALKQYAAYYQKPINDFETQLNFLDMELRFGEKNAFNAIQGATTREGAANAWIDKFERSDAAPDLRAKGVQFAQNFAGLPATDAGGGRTEPSQPADDFRPARSIGDIQARIDFEKQQRAQVAEIRKPLDQIQAAYDANSDNAGWQKYLDEEKQKYAGNTAMQEEFDFRKRFNVGGPKGTQNYDGSIDNSAIEWAKGKLNPQAMAWLQSQWGKSLKIGAENGIITKAGPSTIDTKSLSKEQLTDISLHDPDPTKRARAKETLEALGTKTAPNQLEYETAASRVGTPQEQPGDKEKKAALEYRKKEALETTEARGKGFAEFRPIDVADTKDNTAISGMSQAEVVEANKKEPGRYVVITPSAFEKALRQTALLSDIRMNIGATRESVNGLETDFSQSQRFQIFEAMRANNPHTALSNLIGGEFGKSLKRDQQQYLVDVAALVENAMAMRQVLGAGQGSEDLRDAIRATIPSPTSFSKEYSIKQLAKFDQILNRLESGVLKVKLRTDTGAAGKGTAERPFVKGGETGKPDPAIEAKIKEISGQHTPEEISGFLKEKGVDPTIYGLPK